MANLFRIKAKKLGPMPGSAGIGNGDQEEKAKITLFDYDPQSYREKEIQSIEESFPFKDTATVTWINVEGLDTDVIEKLEAELGIHPLVVEDIVMIGQRPKVEDYGEYEFILFKMISFDKRTKEIQVEQISVILGRNYVISFQETVGDIFDPIREKIRNAKGRTRFMGPDYLAYALLDAVVDHYFVVLDKRGAEIEAMEEAVLTGAHDGTAQAIHRMKRDVVFLRKQIWPLREVLSGFQRNESKLIKKATKIYMRDVYDHTIQIIDTIESFRDTLSGMHDIYISSLSHRINEVMKILTMFAAIFIPLTYITGIYGMNFKYMPGLDWKYGFHALMFFMISAAGGLVFLFKRNKWF
jgi:magnesium transporter